MTYEPLHHKYRPQTFAELVGQEAIAATLTNAIEQQRIAPAYLFTGARGTGKTSSARILAKSLNCLSSPKPTATPCGRCEVCQAIARGSALDVIEIDAASNTGVDNIRELIERAQFAPVQCRYKVYVVDECLTGDALVKTDTGLVRIDDPRLLGKKVLSYNEALQKWEFREVLRWLDQGERQTFVLETDQGTIRCTGNHLIRTEAGWIAARDVKEGMKILSPVSVDVAPSSTNLAQTDVIVDSLEAISSKATRLDKKLTVLTPFLNKLSRFGQLAPVVAVSCLIFLLLCVEKAMALTASFLTGKVIHSNQNTVSGKQELTTTPLNSHPYPPPNWGLSTGLSWVTALLHTQISTADFRGYPGHTVAISENGWNLRQNVCLTYNQNLELPPTRVMEANQSVVTRPAILSLLKFLMLSNRTGSRSKSRWSGLITLPLKDWLGGTWMMVHLVSAIKEAHKFNFIPKATLLRKINSWQIGLQRWDTKLKQSFTPAPKPISSITTSNWERRLLENGYPISNHTQSPQWSTSLATVGSVHLVGVERVYDIEVEGNHNFVANGLLVHNCHMLSTAAFNALLKTLEEPPDRVVFVLATTDPQRVLPTIISRCQRFDYRRIPLDAMVRHLQKIADLEDISIQDEAITLVAQIAQGGLRDAESLLDQLSLLPTQIDIEQVWDLVGSVPERDLLGLLEAIAQDNPEAVLDHTRRLMDRGREPLIVLQNLASFYRDLLIAKTARDRNDLVALTPPTWQHLCTLAESLNIGTILAGQQHLRSAEVQLKHTTQPRLWLEVTLMGLLPSAIAPQPIPAAHPTSPIPRTSPSPSSPPPLPSPSSPTSSPAPQVAPSIPAEPAPIQEAASDQFDWQDQEIQHENAEESAATPTIVNLEQTWQNIISAIQPFSTQVMVKQQCQLLGFDGEQVRLGVSTQPLFKMAQGKLPNIEAAFQQVFGRKVHITLEVAAPGNRTNEQSAQRPSSSFPIAPETGSPVPPATPRSQPPADSPPPPNKLPHPPASQQGTPPPGQKISEGTPPPAASEPHKDFASPWEEDEVTSASKRLADFFAGQVVDLEGGMEAPTSIDKDLIDLEPEPEEPDPDELGSASSWIGSSSSIQEEDEDDDDVPF